VGPKGLVVSDPEHLIWYQITYYNFLLGLGSAFLYQVAAVVITKYFKKRLALATAIARSGMGLTFLLAPFTQFLIELYDWTGESVCLKLSTLQDLNVQLSLCDPWKLCVVVGGGAAVLNLGICTAKQVLYCSSHTSSPFCSGYFGDGVL
jgi:MFS family permease